MKANGFWRKLLFPQHCSCHLCGAWSDGGILCPDCEGKLNRLRLQDLFLPPSGSPLGACAAVWRFEGTARVLIHQLKYHGDAETASWIGEWMSCMLMRHEGAFGKEEMLIPVPLHPRRLRERGYNQALLLAQAISAHTGLPLEREALVRIRMTGALTHSTRIQRLCAIHGAFQADPQRLRGKHLLLIDDVFTTGATSIACAMTMLQAGAKEVSVLTACRTFPRQ